MVYRDSPAFQLESGPDPGTADQFDAADMAPGEHDEWLTRLDVDEVRRNEREADIGLARDKNLGGEGLGLARPLDVQHVGESLAVEQLLRDVLWHETGDGVLVQ